MSKQLVVGVLMTAAVVAATIFVLNRFNLGGGAGSFGKAA